MDIYFEQSVAGQRGSREQLKYGACWAGIVLLALIAMYSATRLLATDGERIVIDWMSVIALVAAVALAVVIYFWKDRVYREYDYILWNSEFEVCAVYNRKRRKKIATIQLSKLNAWGPAALMEKQMHSARRRDWCAGDGEAWCMVYPTEHGKEAALLELSDEMCAQLRASSSSLRNIEVKP